jgi:hypothetical protein
MQIYTCSTGNFNQKLNYRVSDHHILWTNHNGVQVCLDLFFEADDDQGRSGVVVDMAFCVKGDEFQVRLSVLDALLVLICACKCGRFSNDRMQFSFSFGWYYLYRT